MHEKIYDYIKSALDASKNLSAEQINQGLEITIKSSPKEIAALVTELQERHKIDMDVISDEIFTRMADCLVASLKTTEFNDTNKKLEELKELSKPLQEWLQNNFASRTC